MPHDGHVLIPMQYTLGDATRPSERPAIIAHVCNDLGVWGRGFVLAISQRWPHVAESYREWLTYLRRHHRPPLGTVQFLWLEPDLWIVNMIAQHGIQSTTAGPPIRYDALAQSLEKLRSLTLQYQASVHMPRIGCGLAGGTWDRVEPLILDALCAHGIAVTVYDRPHAQRDVHPTGEPAR